MNKEVNGNSKRRNFVRKLVSLGAAAGLAGVLTGRYDGKPILPRVLGADGDTVTVSGSFTGTGTTQISSSQTMAGGVIFGKNTSSSSQGVVGTTENIAAPAAAKVGVQGVASTGIGLRGDSTNGKGVLGIVEGAGVPGGVNGVTGAALGSSGWAVFGNATVGQAVLGLSGGSGQGVIGVTEGGAVPGAAAIGVMGKATTGSGVEGRSDSGIGILARANLSTAIPLVAIGAGSQTSNLQEWRKVSLEALSVVDAAGALTVGVIAPPGDAITGLANAGGIKAAVRGENSSSASSAYGVLGRVGGAPLPPSGEAAAAVRGVCPLSSTGQGVVGSGGNGLVGFGLFAGVHGQGASASAVGVRGVSAAVAGVPSGSTIAIQSAGDLLPDTDNTRNCGVNGARWALVRATIVTMGDLVFENGYRMTEHDGDGLAFLNPLGDRLAVLDGQGNFYVKGEIRNLKELHANSMRNTAVPT